MAQFVRCDNRGLNLEGVLSWTYDLPTSEAEARCDVQMAGGICERFRGLGADALSDYLEGASIDVVHVYHTTQAARMTEQKAGAPVDFVRWNGASTPLAARIAAVVK